MVTIEATTPQLRFLRSYIEAYDTLNMDNVEPFYSKNFKIQTLPKTDERPDMSKDEYLQKDRGMATRIAKLETTIHELVEAPGKIALQVRVRDGGTHVFETFTILTLVEEEG